MSPEAVCCLGLLANRDGFEKLIDLIEPDRRGEFLAALETLAPMTPAELRDRWAELRRDEHAALVRRCEEAFGCSLGHNTKEMASGGNVTEEALW
jgi:hypothetical protein